MTLNEDILNQVDNHLSKFNIKTNNTDRDNILKRVLNGEYAFQIIYTEIYGDLEFKIIKPLDPSKLEFDVELNIWKYDRGEYNTYYGDSEILSIDISIIREIKLSNLLGI